MHPGAAPREPLRHRTALHCQLLGGIPPHEPPPPRLTEASRGRIANVASAGQHPIDFADPQLTSGYDGFTAYRQSKLAQITATFTLADRLGPDGVTVNALHPASFMATTMVLSSGVEPWSTVAEERRPRCGW